MEISLLTFYDDGVNEKETMNQIVNRVTVRRSLTRRGSCTLNKEIHLSNEKIIFGENRLGKRVFNDSQQSGA